MSPHDRADFHPLEVNLAGIQLAQLAIGVLGVLTITAEYSTGMIRASMTAVPRRVPVLVAKAIVYGLTTLALMVPAALLAFVVGEAIFSGRNIDIAFSHPGVAAVAVNPGIIDTEMLRTCFGDAAGSYPTPKHWARKAVPFFLALNQRHNGQSLAVDAGA